MCISKLPENLKSSPNFQNRLKEQSSELSSNVSDSTYKRDFWFLKACMWVFKQISDYVKNVGKRGVHNSLWSGRSTMGAIGGLVGDILDAFDKEIMHRECSVILAEHSTLLTMTSFLRN